MNSGLSVAVLGTGLMGYPMAENILKAGFPVNVWNRTAHKAKPLREFGATVYEIPDEAVLNADVAIVRLTDGYAV